jgi:hypothetical protein
VSAGDVLYTSREDWLVAALEELRPFFSLQGKPLPQAIRLACGFPLNARRSGAIGECWANTSSADGTIEVLISPVLADPRAVFEVLVHELCHATDGAMNHGRPFQAIATWMHLRPIGSGKQAWKSTEGDSGFADAYGAVIASLGVYPHAALSFAARPKQTTRMLKATCGGCGYTVRVSQRWAVLGLPVCGGCTQTFDLAGDEA